MGKQCTRRCRGLLRGPEKIGRLHESNTTNGSFRPIRLSTTDFSDIASSRDLVYPQLRVAHQLSLEHIMDS